MSRIASYAKRSVQCPITFGGRRRGARPRAHEAGSFDVLNLVNKTASSLGAVYCEASVASESGDRIVNCRAGNSGRPTTLPRS
jgi:hypothetical protein